MNYFNLSILLAVLIVADANASNDNGTVLVPVEPECIVTSFEDVERATANCSCLIINGITVPAGIQLFLNLTTGASLTFQGNISFEKGNWTGPLVLIRGAQLTVKGDPGHVFDGLGAQYWDGLGDLGLLKPKFFRVRTNDSTFSNINLLNCPKQCVSVNNARNTILSNFYLDVSYGDIAGGHNTDGFDISSSNNIIIQDSVVKNQDDCVAVNQGSNFLIRNLTCSGGHGLSLSVGQSPLNGSVNTVSNVTFVNCTVINSRNAIHLKTHTDSGTGQISNVTYKDILISNITRYGINIQQDYFNGSSTGIATGNIPITALTMKSITGSMTYCANNTEAVYILCGTGGCDDWFWSGVSITHSYLNNSCNFEPTGFTC